LQHLTRRTCNVGNMLVEDKDTVLLDVFMFDPAMHRSGLKASTAAKHAPHGFLEGAESAGVTVRSVLARHLGTVGA
jgi:hypothetical protein